MQVYLRVRLGFPWGKGSKFRPMWGLGEDHVTWEWALRTRLGSNVETGKRSRASVKAERWRGCIWRLCSLYHGLVSDKRGAELIYRGLGTPCLLYIGLRHFILHTGDHLWAEWLQHVCCIIYVCHYEWTHLSQSSIPIHSMCCNTVHVLLYIHISICGK